MDFWPYIKTLPDEMTSFACQVLEEGDAEVERLQKLEEGAVGEEKILAARQLEQLGAPGVWFRRRFSEKYPGLTEDQMSMLFAFACRATL